jgi:hypothetical protein
MIFAMIGTSSALGMETLLFHRQARQFLPENAPQLCAQRLREGVQIFPLGCAF